MINLKIFLLTIWPMPSDKHNSITAKAMGLISSLFNVASSRDVPFCQLLQLQCSHHGSTKVLLCFPLPRRWRFAVYTLWLRCETRVSAVLAEVLLTYLKCYLKCSKLLEMKHSDTPWSSDTPTIHYINW